MNATRFLAECMGRAVMLNRVRKAKIATVRSLTAARKLDEARQEMNQVENLTIKIELLHELLEFAEIFQCDTCDRDTRNEPKWQAPDELWDTHASLFKGKVLCRKCFETMIGRPLKETEGG